MAKRRSKKYTWNEKIARREARRKSAGAWYSMKDSMNEFVILPGGSRMLLRRGFGRKTMQREALRFYRRAAGCTWRHDASYD
ncbi:MAG: hypothetical protein J6K32_02425 [Clostridia bacterium]|nr:hypothetical protein [Clostridia bacterium]